MEATELRLNNYFDIVNRTNEVHLPRGGAYKVIELAPFSVSYCKVEESPATIEQWKKVDVRDICGIPLTEEWLVKLGFNFCEGFVYLDGSKQDLWIKTFGEYAIGRGYKDAFTLQRKDHAGQWHFVRVCEYVHTLQNVVHALAGTDLTLKKQHA